MREPSRIEPFLTELGTLWKNNVPDWRFGQLMMNFIVWCQTEKQRDMFFPEEFEFLQLFKEYLTKEKKQ